MTDAATSPGPSGPGPTATGQPARRTSWSRWSALSVRQHLIFLTLIAAGPFAGLSLYCVRRLASGAPAPSGWTLAMLAAGELGCAALAAAVIAAVSRRFAAGGRVLHDAATALAAERRVIAQPTGVREYDEAVAALASASLLLRLRADERSRAEQSLARRGDEQTVLYRFADALYHAATARQVYETALDALMSAMKCSRASISLLDKFDKARFVAWRGLSERYRSAVDGQCPWTVDDPEPRPVSYDYIGFADVPPSLISDVMGEGVCALAFAPLLAHGRLSGKLVAYYDAPHRFTRAEHDLMLTLGRQLSLALDRVHADTARRSAEERLVRDDAPVGSDRKST